MTQSAIVADVTLQQLRTFCVVFTEKSYSGAAKRTGLSVPATWEQIRALEKSYGIELFRRSGRGVQPTHAAKLLYGSLLPLLAGLDSTRELVREAGGESPPAITVVTGMSLVIDIMPALRHFSGEPGHGRTGLCVRQVSDQIAAELVAAGGADVALTLVPDTQTSNVKLLIEPICAVSPFALFPAFHPAAQSQKLGLADLVSHVLVVGAKESCARQLLDAGLNRAGLTSKLQVAFEPDAPELVMGCALAGMGVGIAVGPEGQFSQRGLATCSLQSELGKASISIISQRGRQLTATLTRLVQLLRDNVIAGVGAAEHVRGSVYSDGRPYRRITASRPRKQEK